MQREGLVKVKRDAVEWREKVWGYVFTTWTTDDLLPLSTAHRFHFPCANIDTCCYLQYLTVCHVLCGLLTVGTVMRFRTLPSLFRPPLYEPLITADTQRLFFTCCLKMRFHTVPVRTVNNGHLTKLAVSDRVSQLHVHLTPYLKLSGHQFAKFSNHCSL